MDDYIDFGDSKYNELGQGPRPPAGTHTAVILNVDVKKSSKGTPYVKFVFKVGDYAPVVIMLFMSYGPSRALLERILGYFNISLEKRKYSFSEFMDILSVLIGKTLKITFHYDKNDFAILDDVEKTGRYSEELENPSDDLPPF